MLNLTNNVQEDLFDNYEIDVVIYDEIEKFREPNILSPKGDMEFNYPFQNRTSLVTANTIDIKPINFIPEFNGDEYNYEYKTNLISFKLSQVCLESNPILQFDFITPVINTVNNYLNYDS